ncbi:MAG: solute carrier family 12 sodium/potassium/chloride transporter 2 [Planctomycetota bacterium]|jgi:solute carrier family 12 sodium/potassium/chloride transporter 2
MKNTNKGFGTLPVFLTTISTILGAILFLRFGWAVGNLGFWGVLLIIGVGHIVTITTAMAVSEIATNQKVEGGGAYFIISRSFGLDIGAAIGIALYLAQAISVAFYVIAFSEAFHPLFDYFGYVMTDNRLIALPAMSLLTILILTKGADLGVKALYIVAGILFISIILFFLGSTDYVPPVNRMVMQIENPENFFFIFTIIFPAFTGIAAGLGLSGDLENPKRAIPMGTLTATIVGMIIYVFIAYKLTMSASPEDLANDQLIMGKIALWGPAIPIGLAAATISSALGSIMIAPRTLQALGSDKIFPNKAINQWTAKENLKKKEPINATILTCLIAFVFVGAGNVNFVAEIISMFFMVTYGAINLVSFFEHFAADPSYRPTFKSKWWLSLIGSIACFYLMFKMNFIYAIMSTLLMVAIFFIVSYFNEEKKALSKIFQGVIFQLSRSLQLFLQKSNTDLEVNDWRPSVVCLSKDYHESLDGFDFLRWISSKYGFGTYIHMIDGYLSKETSTKAKDSIDNLINLTEKIDNKIFFSSIVSPSLTSAIAQVIQLPGITGKKNNTILFEYDRINDKTNSLNDFVSNYSLIKALNFDTYLLSTTHRGFGFKKNVSIWITDRDFDNANLMILTAFIIIGHKDWKDAQIKIYSITNEKNAHQLELHKLISDGRLPISINNIEILTASDNKSTSEIICEKSQNVDLTIIGFRPAILKHEGTKMFDGYDHMGNILFVNSTNEVEIV